MAIASFRLACAKLSVVVAECKRSRRIGRLVLAMILLPSEGRPQALVPIQLQPIEVVVNRVAGYDSVSVDGISLGVRANCIELTIPDGSLLYGAPQPHATVEFVVPGIPGESSIVVARRAVTPAGPPLFRTSLSSFNSASRGALIGFVTSELLEETYVLPFDVPLFDPVDSVAQAWVAGDRIRWELRASGFGGPYSLRLSAWSISSVPAASDESCDAPIATEDSDGDTVLDGPDNCPAIANVDQMDADSDGVGDACNDEADQDGDEFSDSLDNCPVTVNADQANVDGDAVGDVCDPFPDDPQNDLAQCSADYAAGTLALFACNERVTTCSGERDLFQANSTTCNAQLSEAQSSLSEVENDLIQATADDDFDGVLNVSDSCFQTALGQFVDEVGCSRAEFCGRTTAEACGSSDWLNDEPLTLRPEDCLLDGASCVEAPEPADLLGGIASVAALMRLSRNPAGRSTR